MATLKLPTAAAEKVAPKLGLVGLDPNKAAAREAARQAAELAAAKAKAEAEAKAAAEAKQEAERAANRAAKLAQQRTEQLAAEARRRAARLALTARLCERWPDIFDVGAPKPLAIGIGRQIRAALDEVVPDKVMRRALHRWTDKQRYLMALAEGGPRYNLDGSEAGVVTEDQRAHAQALLDQRDGEAQARIAAREAKATRRAA